MGRMFVSAGLHGAACCRFACRGATRPHGVQVDEAQQQRLKKCDILILQYGGDATTLLARRPRANKLNVYGENITYYFYKDLSVRPSIRGACRGQPRPA
jgi:hypothetical protein